MKSELIANYNLEDGTKISRVLPIDRNNFLFLTVDSRSKEKKFCINLKGDIERKIEVAYVQNPHELNYFTSLFKFRNGFGLLEYTGRVWLWDSLATDPKKFTIKDPFPSENSFVKGFASCISHDGENFVLGIEEPLSYGFPAKYWCSFELKSNFLFGLPLPGRKLSMGAMYALDIAKYPETSRRQGEWLNILSLIKKGDKILLHTNGGAATRLKSGLDFEFSLLSVMDEENNHIRNFEIEKGMGTFSSDKNYFLLDPKNGKRRLMFYGLESFEVEFEISISDLKEGKSEFVFFDLCGDCLYAYGKDFLHIRRIINEG